MLSLKGFASFLCYIYHELLFCVIFFRVILTCAIRTWNHINIAIFNFFFFCKFLRISKKRLSLKKYYSVLRYHEKNVYRNFFGKFLAESIKHRIATVTYKMQQINIIIFMKSKQLQASNGSKCKMIN